LLKDRQTNKQTNKVWQKHYLLGTGKKIIYIRDCSQHLLCWFQNVAYQCAIQSHMTQKLRPNIKDTFWQNIDIIP